MGRRDEGKLIRKFRGRNTDEEAVIREYNSLAPEYDERWFRYVRLSVRETIRRLDFRASERLLDIGCGTGTLLRAVAKSFPDAMLNGIDPSPEMLAAAREKLGYRTELRVGIAESLPFDDDSFDVVVSSSSLHYWRHPETALAEIVRILKPNGRIVITDWCGDYLPCRVCDMYLRLVNRAHYRTFGTKKFARLLESAGFGNTRIDRYRISWLWGLMTATGMIGKKDTEQS